MIVPDCQLFTDPEKQEQFEKEGYTVVDMFPPEQVEKMQAYYDSLHNAPMPEQGYQITIDNEDPEFVAGVIEHLEGFASPYFSKQFKDFKFLTSSFFVKEPNPLSFFQIHQDYSVIYEEKYWSASVWCPLVDVNIDNGAVGVLKGSHKIFHNLRPNPSPFYRFPYSGQEKDIFPFMKVIELKAGQALVFNNRTLHASTPNISGKPRCAAAYIITHKDADLVFYYTVPEGDKIMLDEYAIDKDFLIKCNPKYIYELFEKGEKIPGYNIVGRRELVQPVYATEELIRRLKAEGNVADERLAQKWEAYENSRQEDQSPEQEPTTDEASPEQEVSATKEPVLQPVAAAAGAGGADEKRTFWHVYSIKNIIAEIKHRLFSKN